LSPEVETATIGFVNQLGTVAVVGVVVLALVIAAGLTYRMRRRQPFGSDADRATYTALHTMAQASPPLRDRLSAASATAAAPHLRA